MKFFLSCACNKTTIIMDLSKLSADLPLSQPVGDAEVSALNKELSEEFKIGARSIAALYRLSNTKTQMMQAKGYLDCINDVLALIDSKPSLEEVKNVLNSKRGELTGFSKPTDVSQNQFENGEFTLNNPTQFHFPLAQTPISVNPQLKHPPKTSKQQAKKQIQTENNHDVVFSSQNQDELTDSEEEGEMEQVMMDSGLESLKRKFLNDTPNAKKPKFDELC